MAPITSNVVQGALRASLLSLALIALVGEASGQARRGGDGPTVRATAPVVVAGKETPVSGSGFAPGQKVVLSAAGKPLNTTPYVVDAEGKFSGQAAIPSNAVIGSLPVQISAVGSQQSFEIAQFKISRIVPLSGEDRIEATSAKLAGGLYQSAYGAQADAVFVSSSSAGLLKVDPTSLQITASIKPGLVPVDPAAKAEEPSGKPRRGNGPATFSVFGLTTDNDKGTVWVTNTPQNTVAVYRQSDLSLLKQFPSGTVSHARDVAVDELHGRAYASSMGSFLAAFDTNTLQQLPNVEIASTIEGRKFTPMSLDVDAATGAVYTVSLHSPEAAVIDGATGRVQRVLHLPGVEGAIGVAYDSGRKRLLTVSSSGDNLLILDATSGQLLHNVYVGAGAINVAVEPQSGLAYVSSRAAGTLTVVDGEGRIVANLSGGSNPNHVQEDGKGNVFAINKSNGANDPMGDRITRLRLKAAR